MIDKKELFMLLDQKKLKARLVEEFTEAGIEYIDNDGYLYVPGSVNVLMVSHMDTVHSEPPIICQSDNGDIWMSPTGLGADDRCGVYALLELKKRVDVSLLFCEDEEIGSKGAAKFVADMAAKKITPDVPYGIIEIDRRHLNDAVFYSCGNVEWQQIFTDAQFKKENGSFSDICKLSPAFDAASVNISAAYDNEHTNAEYCVWSVLEQNINRIEQVINKLSSDGIYYDYQESNVSRFMTTLGSGSYSYGSNYANGYPYNYGYDYDNYDQYEDYGYGYGYSVGRQAEAIIKQGKNIGWLKSDAKYTSYFSPQIVYDYDASRKPHLAVKYRLGTFVIDAYGFIYTQMYINGECAVVECKDEWDANYTKEMTPSQKASKHEALLLEEVEK